MSLTSIIAVILALGTVSCGGTPEAAIADAVKNQPDARAFAQLFPGAEHFISHYTGTAGSRVWNSHVLLYERYVLTMQFDMVLDAGGIQVTATSPPKYVLHEVTSVTIAPTGQVSILYGESVEFGKEEWKKLQAANGDLTSVGVKPKTNQPVPNLKANWRGA